MRNDANVASFDFSQLPSPDAVAACEHRREQQKILTDSLMVEVLLSRKQSMAFKLRHRASLADSDAAKRMNITRQAFSRLVNAAEQKVEWFRRGVIECGRDLDIERFLGLN